MSADYALGNAKNIVLISLFTISSSCYTSDEKIQSNITKEQLVSYGQSKHNPSLNKWAIDGSLQSDLSEMTLSQDASRCDQPMNFLRMFAKVYHCIDCQKFKLEVIPQDTFPVVSSVSNSKQKYFCSYFQCCFSNQKRIGVVQEENI